MINGGENDVYQAIMQCFAALTVFLRYFMKDKHIKANISEDNKVHMTTMMNKVFESLYREQLAFTPPYVNIKFFT